MRVFYSAYRTFGCSILSGIFRVERNDERWYPTGKLVLWGHALLGTVIPHMNDLPLQVTDGVVI